MNTEERERVERVARDVMAWRDNGFGRWLDPAGVHVAWTEDGYDDVADPVYAWNPFVSASDDYDVLQKVRETWGSGRLADFHLQLEVTWRSRWGWQADVPVPMRYEAGDYAEAALSVLGARTQETPG